MVWLKSFDFLYVFPCVPIVSAGSNGQAGLKESSGGMLPGAVVAPPWPKGQAGLRLSRQEGEAGI